MENKFAPAFDEWMRRFIDEPERFSREFQDVIDFQQDIAFGEKPRYGLECAAYFEKLLSEV